MALQVGELFAKLGLESKEFDQGMDQAEGRFSKLSKGIMGGVAALATGIVAGLGAGVKAAGDLNGALRNLQMQTGMTDKEMAGMRDSLVDIYNGGYGESFDDIAQAMATTQQNTGLAGKELQNVTKHALSLRDTMGYDVVESTEAANQMMKFLGTTGDQSMNMIAEATQKGLNKHGDLIDTIKEYSMHFDNAGLDAEDMFGIFENASKAGVRNLDYVGDAIKEFGIRMKDGSDTTADALTALGLPAGELTKEFAKGGDSAKNAYSKIMEAMAGVEDPLERNQIGVALFGTKFEDLEADAVLAMGNVEGSIKNGSKALGDINKIKFDSFGAALTGIWRQIQTGLLVPIGDLLLPILNKFANFLNDNLPAAIAFVKGVFGGFKDTIMDLIGGFGGAGAAGQALSTLWNAVFGAMKSVIIPIMGAIKDMVVSAITTIVSWWKANGADLLANMTIIWNAIKAVIDFVMPLILLIIKSVWASVVGVIKGAMNVISGVMKIFAGLFTGDWRKMWDGIKQLLKGAVQVLWHGIQLFFVGKMIKGIKTGVTLAKGAVKGMWTSIKATFSRMMTGAVNIMKNMMSGIVKYFKNIYSQARSIFTLTRSFTTNIFSRIWTTVRSVISNMYNGIRSKFMSILNSAKSLFSSMLNTIRSRFTSASNAGKNAFTSLVNAVRSKITSIVNAVRNLGTRITSTFTSLKSKALGWGRNIMGGLLNGITSGAQSVYNKAKNIANNITSKIKSALKIFSPSRVMVGLGEYTTEGLEVGMGNAEGSLMKSANRMVNRMVDTMSAPAADVQAPAVVRAGVAGPNQTPIQVLTNLVMDGRTVGRTIAKHVSDKQYQTTRGKTRTKGLVRPI